MYCVFFYLWIYVFYVFYVYLFWLFKIMYEKNMEYGVWSLMSGVCNKKVKIYIIDINYKYGIWSLEFNVCSMKCIVEF